MQPDVTIAEPGEYPEIEEVLIVARRQSRRKVAGTRRIMHPVEQPGEGAPLTDPLGSLYTAPAIGYPDSER